MNSQFLADLICHLSESVSEGDQQITGLRLYDEANRRPFYRRLVPVLGGALLRVFPGPSRLSRPVAAIKIRTPPIYAELTLYVRSDGVQPYFSPVLIRFDLMEDWSSNWHLQIAVSDGSGLLSFDDFPTLTCMGVTTGSPVIPSGAKNTSKKLSSFSPTTRWRGMDWATVTGRAR
jgi:hypothetical protein